MLWNLQSYCDGWGLESSTEMLLAVIQKIAADIVLIYCFHQIAKGSFNTNLLKRSINIRSYLFSSLLLLCKAMIQLKMPLQVI